MNLSRISWSISSSISVVSTISVLRLLEFELAKLMALVRESFSHTTQCMFNIKDPLCFKWKMAFPIQSEKEGWSQERSLRRTRASLQQYNWCKFPLWMFCTGLYHGKHSIHFQIWGCTLISANTITSNYRKCLRQGKERLCCKICFSRCSSKNISSYVASFILLNAQLLVFTWRH